ncbi:MAG: hypothetical protein IJU20_06985 [Clostridia bacterium]|nr:hypothetical protein [Clostridia bacterium]
MNHSINPETRARRIGSFLNSTASVVISVGFLLFLLFLTLSSFLLRADCVITDSNDEQILFVRTSFWFSLCVTAILILLCLLVHHLNRMNKVRIPLPAYMAGMVLLVFSFGLKFLLSAQSAPTHDSWIVTRAADLASRGDFTFLNRAYFSNFPFQLGYVLWSEGWIRLFHLQDNYLPLEIVNLVCLCVAECALVDWVRTVTGKESVARSCCVLFVFCLPPVLFSTFLYGNLPGLCFAALCLSLLCRFARSRHPVSGLAGALCAGLAVMLKKNNLILIVAILLLGGVALVRDILLHAQEWKAKEKLKRILPPFFCLALVLSLSILLPGLAQRHYEKRTGNEYGSGVPMICWIDMGLHEGRSEAGWYSYEYTLGNYYDNNCDAEKTSAAAKGQIKERLDELWKNSDLRRDFFARKLQSMWNEPTGQSIWNVTVRDHYRDMGKLATALCVTHADRTTRFMQCYQQLLYTLASVGVIGLLLRRKQYPLSAFSVPLFVLGGLLYHLLAEAKSQYAISYMVMLVPLAAIGIEGLYERCKKRKERTAKPDPDAPAEETP